MLRMRVTFPRFFGEEAWSVQEKIVAKIIFKICFLCSQAPFVFPGQFLLHSLFPRSTESNFIKGRGGDPMDKKFAAMPGIVLMFIIFMTECVGHVASEAPTSKVPEDGLAGRVIGALSTIVNPLLVVKIAAIAGCLFREITILVKDVLVPLFLDSSVEAEKKAEAAAAAAEAQGKSGFTIHMARIWNTCKPDAM